LNEKKRSEAGGVELTGTTLRVYRYLYRMGKPCGIREIQRGLGLSSSSVALYHVRKLLDAGLIREERERPSPVDGDPRSNGPDENGSQGDPAKGSSGYVVDRVIYENMIRIRRSLIPVQVAYSMFFATALVVLLLILRPSAVSGAYVFALFVIAAACGIFGYQAFKSLSRSEV
jgi:hypothetical protein